ncbi:MAG: glycosyltransferase [Alphaproteobacteria bacterium]
MSKRKISVILPVKNGERYIYSSIKSILSQTFRDFELLVIDDGSTDQTHKIVLQLQHSDHRLQFLRNPGSGLVDALNYGIASASGELIARMDADDICLPNRFQKQHDYLVRHPEIAVLGTQVRFINEHGEPMGHNTTLPETPKAIADDLLKQCCLRHPTVMMRKAAVEKLGGYRHQLIYAEDYDLWLRMSEQYSLANLPEQLLLYRMHAGQLSEQREWSQRLARNLALISAIERRQNGIDPITSFACFSKTALHQQCRGNSCPSSVCETVKAFETARKLTSSELSPLLEGESWQMLRFLFHNQLGDGRNSRHRVLLALSRSAAQRRALFELIVALGMAIKVHPGRTIKWLFRQIYFKYIPATANNDSNACQ